MSLLYTASAGTLASRFNFDCEILSFPPEKSNSSSTGNGRSRSRQYSGLFAVFGKAEIRAEKRHHVILDPVCSRTDMGAGIDLEAVRDAIAIEDGGSLVASNRRPSWSPTSIAMARYCLRSLTY